jgi:hypothetical protein
MKIKIELTRQEMVHLLTTLHYGSMEELEVRFKDAWNDICKKNNKDGEQIESK